MKRVFDDLSVFCAVVEKRSMKQASVALGIPHSTVSRRIDALERSLGLHLLHRTTREVRVTHRGEQLYRDCSPLLESLGNSVDLAIDREVTFKGALSVSMPVRAGLDFLGNWLIDFASEHNELKLELSLSNVNLNLVQENIDLAFRVGPLVDSSAIALRLWDIPYYICATRDYLGSNNLPPEPLTLEQIEQLPCVVAMPARAWTLIDEDHSERLIQPNAQLVVDDLSLAYHAVKGGHFMGMIPDEMIADSEVIKLEVKNYTPRTRTMFAYYLGKRHTISQIRHIVDYIKARYLEKAPN